MCDLVKAAEFIQGQVKLFLLDFRRRKSTSCSCSGCIVREIKSHPFWGGFDSGKKFSMHSSGIDLNSYCKLTVVKIGIETVFLQQFIMRALLDDIPIADDQNMVRITDGRKTMSDNEAGASVH